VSEHFLAPLLAPRSVAFVGASQTPGSIGNKALREMVRGGFTGRVYPVNPRYNEVEGFRCYKSLAELPEPPDLAILMLATERLETILAEAADCGTRAAVIYDGAYLHNADPPLPQRLAAIARAARMPVCGSNCTGFINLDNNTRAFPWPPAHDLEAGHVALISHSGSTFGGLMRNERRLHFNLAVSPGHELSATVADYIDFALEMETTRVIGIYIETARDPQGFVAALAKAERRNIPVVAIKVGRSAFSAELAQSHSGAIAGNDVAYHAVFEQYGVHQVDDIDEMVATLQLFAQPRSLARGGLAAIGDSGGERELVVDLATNIGVPFAQIDKETEAKLTAELHPSLRPINPLDAYAGPHDFAGMFGRCFEVLLEDSDSALGMIFSNVLAGFPATECYIDICRTLIERSDKPIAVASLFAGTEHGDYAQRMGELGIPVIYGATPALKAVRHLLAHRDRAGVAASEPPPAFEPRLVESWRQRLSSGVALDEAESLALLGDFGIPVVPLAVAEDLQAVLTAAETIGYPMALKTAMPGILHKSDAGGVKLGITDAAALGVAYADLAARLGPRVLLSRMAPAGIEMGLGVIVDPQFGPLVMVAPGGTHIALFRDAQYDLAPIGRAAARRMIDRLAVKPLLDGHRGAPQVDIDRLAEVLHRLSWVAALLGDRVSEIDVNPYIATQGAGVAVDAIVVGARPAAGSGRGASGRSA
jgi:acyl-CoA synthetase (NDP forming)